MTSTAIEDHLHYCTRRGLRPTYIDNVGSTLRRVQRELGVPVEHATSEELEGWWNALTIGDGRLAYVAMLSSFYRWLIFERVRDDDPTVRLVRPKQRRGLPRPIADTDLQRALDHAGGRMRAWLALAAFAGLRACEIAPLRRDDIDTELGLILVVDGKGGKQRTVPTHPVIAAALETMPMSGFLFPVRGTGPLPVSANAVSAYASRYLRGLGITATLHQLRHWYGTRVYRISTDLRLTQELLGHSSPATTARYTAWAPERAAGVVNALAVGS